MWSMPRIINWSLFQPCPAVVLPGLTVGNVTAHNDGVAIRTMPGYQQATTTLPNSLSQGSVECRVQVLVEKSRGNAGYLKKVL